MLVCPLLWKAVIHHKSTGYQLVQKSAHFQSGKHWDSWFRTNVLYLCLAGPVFYEHFLIFEKYIKQPPKYLNRMIAFKRKIKEMQLMGKDHMACS